METIKNYLDNMFAGLPKTAKIAELKSNLLATMEDKYNELKSQGKSENEAIGIVISEFGNIDELMNELGIQKDDEVTNSMQAVSENEVEEYLHVKRRNGFLIGLGVSLCIMGVALLILCDTLFKADIPGVILLFVFVAVAVSLFIYSGISFESYKYMEEGVQLPFGIEADLKNRYNQLKPIFTLMLILGVCMIVLSPIAIFVGDMISDDASVYGLVVLMFIVATSVFIFINFGITREGYERLLKVGEYTVKNKSKMQKENEDKVIGAVASIVWPLAVAIFLFSGFVYNLWHIAWLIFPITGILFGSFSAVYSILTDKK